MTTKITTLNTAGTRNPQRRREILHNIETSQNDITLLQETHITPDMYRQTSKLWTGTMLFSPGKQNTDGTIICIKDNSIKPTNTVNDPNGKFQITDIRIDKLNITLINVYAPSGNTTQNQYKRREFWEDLAKTMSALIKQDKHYILAGDFNVTLQDIDRQSRASQKYRCHSQSSLLNLIHMLDVEDTFRTFHPNEKQFTHYHHQTNTRTRIDRIYTSKTLRPYITKAEHTPTTLSDHYNAVTVTITTQTHAKGKGYWIFNNAILKNQAYVDLITEQLQAQIDKRPDTNEIPEWWENTKHQLKQTTLKYAKKTYKQNKAKELQLTRKLRNTLRKEEKKQLNNTISTNIRHKLEQIQRQKEEAARIRTKQAWNNDGERPTHFFCNLEKRRQAQHEITQLRDQHGNTKEKPEEILDIMTDFYEKLYTRENLDLQLQEVILKETKTPKLTETQQKQCDEEYTEKEITDALKNMENDKSPGTDGLTAEFYKKFWPLLTTEFTKMTNAVLNWKYLTGTQREALICCIYKKGDRADITNWRPISLLNIDYKIITKTITNRIKATLPHLISRYQTACIPQRQIHMNLWYTRDIIKIANIENLKNAAIISIDQIKAFDRVDWSYLSKTLHKYRYGNKTVQNIATLYTNITTKIKANGHISRPFHPTRGVRQGCPLSLTLYILQADILIQNIQQNRLIKGIKVNHRETKVTAYADYTLFFIRKLKSMKNLDDTLQKFEKATGQKLNREKCQGLWIGRNKNKTTAPLGLNWMEKNIQTLGLTLPNDGTDDITGN